MRWPAFCVGWCSALVAVLRCPVAPLRCLVFCAGCPAGCFPMEFCSNAPASNNSVRVPPASSIFPIALRCSAPASNKPHSAEKSTPVWLAIWRIWAGFANSQLLPDAAALSSMQGLPWSGNSSAQTSASLHPPAALRLRCLPFTRDMGVHGLCGRVPDSAGNVSPWIESAQTDANLSAHLHRLPTPPPYLRQMRLLPGRGAGVGC